jgi:hypothetical protein
MAVRQSATGVVIGRREGEKVYVFDVVSTPDPEDSQEDIRRLGGGNTQKGLLQLLQTKYPDFNYTDWVIEFKNAVSTFLKSLAG